MASVKKIFSTERRSPRRKSAASILCGITQDRSYEFSYLVNAEGFLDIWDAVLRRMPPAYEDKFGFGASGLYAFRKLSGGGAGDMKVHYYQAEAA